MKTLSKRGALLVVALLGAGSVLAQDVPLAIEMPLVGVEEYRDDIPKPQDVIGHEIGTRHTVPHQVVEYFLAVAGVSDRVVVNEHGRTYENRPLIHAVVTSPENHARLEEIRAANLRLSDDASGVSDDELADMPAVIYQGYSVHGNEASGTEAAILYLYHLAAGEGLAVDDALENVVVIIDPMFNPDGRDRFADWVNRNRGTVHTTDPQDREHREDWPFGRTNHFLFDLNRDWLPVQLKESQARMSLFHHWRPQILTDHHEMGGNATFFFQPGIPSRTNPNTPSLNQELTEEIGTYHARALDRIGSMYYSKESFDDFYYGKGSTFPDVNGAIGILFEQASSRSLETETANGNLRYAFTVRNQFATSLSTVAAAAAMREKLLRYQRDFYRGVADFARQFPVKAYVVSGARPSRAKAMIDILLQHRVRVHRLARDYQAGGISFAAGDAYVVPVDQPQGRLIKAAMERTRTFQDSLFYDVSSWTLPLAFGVDAAEVRQNPSALMGASVSLEEQPIGTVVGSPAGFAYVIEWGRYYTPRAVYRLQNANVRVRLSREPFTINVGGQPRRFERGALVIPVTQSDVSSDLVHDAIETVAKSDAVNVYAVNTGLAIDGPDLGTSTATVLEKPKIALVAGESTSIYNVGEVWHLLSDRFQVPVSLIDADRVGTVDLSRYNVLVLASNADVDVDAVKEWVRSGGRLVTLQTGTDWAVRNEVVTLTRKSFDMDSLLTERPYEEIGRTRGAQQIGGSIFQVSLDNTHPIAYGYGERTPVFRRGTTFYEPAEDPGTRVGVYTEEAVISGYISAQQLERAPGSAAISAHRVGRGRVILFADNPNFRAFWYGTNGLFLNAVFLGGAF